MFIPKDIAWDQHLCMMFVDSRAKRRVLKLKFINKYIII